MCITFQILHFITNVTCTLVASYNELDGKRKIIYFLFHFSFKRELFPWMVSLESFGNGPRHFNYYRYLVDRGRADRMALYVSNAVPIQGWTNEDSIPWASWQIRKHSGCRECSECFPNHCKLAIPACIMAPAVTYVPWCMPGSLSRGFLWRRRCGKRTRHSRRMRNPQFYVSGKRPMETFSSLLSFFGGVGVGVGAFVTGGFRLQRGTNVDPWRFLCC